MKIIDIVDQKLNNRQIYKGWLFG